MTLGARGCLPWAPGALGVGPRARGWRTEADWGGGGSAGSRVVLGLSECTRGPLPPPHHPGPTARIHCPGTPSQWL